MKKLNLSIIFALCIFTFVNAQETNNTQELTSKKGFAILPEAGDVSIGFDATPVVDFFLNVANIMNNTGQTAVHPDYVGGFNQVLVGKYFQEDNLAIRGKLAINTNSVRSATFFDNPDDVFNAVDEPSEFKDIKVVKSNSIILGGGLEYRRGHNRLQGFYGGEAILGFSSNSTKNTWAVEIDETSITNGYLNGDGTPINGRLLKQKSGMGITFGLRGFIGVEYFFAPKISIAGEFGWGFGISTNPRGTSTTEDWDAASSTVEENTNEGSNSNNTRGFQVDNGAAQNLLPSAALTMLFHF